MAAEDEGYSPVEQISIFEIRPDFAQPRRAMPSVVRRTWDRDPATLVNVFQAWVQLAGEERGTEFVVDEFLQGERLPRASKETADPEGEDLEEDSEGLGPIESSLTKVIRLAATIYRDGG